MVHVTKRVTPGSDHPTNPSRAAYGQRVQLMTGSVVHVTAGIVHVANLTPGSDNPTLAWYLTSNELQISTSRFPV